MTDEQLKNAVAPCGILCYTCFGYIDGGIPDHAKKLLELYRGWYSGHVTGYGDDPTPEQKEKLERIRIFIEMLKELTLEGREHCDGCHKREGKHGGCIPGCIVPDCTKEHGVDYCAFCPSFPCEKEIPYGGWLDANRYIKEHGLAEFFETHKNRAHYLDCVIDELEP